MGIITAASVLPLKLKPSLLTDLETRNQTFFLQKSRRRSSKKNISVFPVARLFGPALFEASKLKVLFLGVGEDKHPGKLPRAYTLTHSDITSKLTLAVSHTINNSQLQGWYNKLQRDEVVAEWKKIKGKMSLHVHCHISGGHFMLDLFARLRHYIFYKELPMVLRAFVHGDESLFNNYPELKESLVWVYFHSNIPEFNKVECWGPLEVASTPTGAHVEIRNLLTSNKVDANHRQCPGDCACCFPQMSLIPWPKNHDHVFECDSKTVSEGLGKTVFPHDSS